MKLTFGILLLIASAFAQPPRPAAPPKSPKDGAPVDLTGYWVSIVTEDWRWRMVTPLKGDAASVPVNTAARKVIDAWDAAKDEAAGQQCKAYGAPAVMRIPGRVHITWQDDNTLKIETDAGTQTRTFHFGGTPPQGATPSWQGYSVARWEPGPPRSGGFGLGTRTEGTESRSLEVVTTQLRPGYLRKNGAPYSGNTVVKEFFDLSNERNGDTWFVVTTIVEDPRNLTEPFVTSTNFKKQKDGTGFSPTACSSR